MSYLPPTSSMEGMEASLLDFHLSAKVSNVLNEVGMGINLIASIVGV